ncbi:MAG: endolytic transglycosylase MltG, partial [Alphaproteobacteria bacterium]|nr:endolytic transglycosylase MltG [Alphaproteobacteria bacterium]
MSEPSEDQSQTETSGTESTAKSNGLGRVLRRSLVLFLALGVLMGGAAIGLVFWAQETYHAPGPLQKQVDIVIEPGTSLQGIARQLQGANVIEYPKVFVAMLRYLNQHTHLKAGEYRFSPGLSQAEVAETLISHHVVEHLITIPEGLTVTEIFQLIDQADG